ncbi:uncharacterized protein NECHADRAFT_80839 [Fusarium vanettenii 77-13-4]|uniref:Uncharacterized protein n=1 Tax=Fusarium vanettenii (strain ATCC MYA-4622 / CBS 123669 / FGSC 9596 / NRRL 45880 / 77-13-4) TaxID=660122 RepID=C7YSS9_FUSV7|nr:uncharacterized protein NECHADRAFT_80839 [Fusarium vanettenii 77-13-4]EEU45700.1 predicted protein [Fusarium vanettenii 77-13-4]
MEQHLPLQPDQDLVVAEEVDRQVDVLGSVAPGHSEEAIFIDRRDLWSSFFGYSLSIRRRLARHLALLQAIREASPSGYAITDASQDKNPVRFLSWLRCFRDKPTPRDPSVKPDRMMLKINKDMALSDLNHMLDILDIAKMLPKPSRPPFSPRWALWTVGCSTLSAVASLESLEVVAGLLRAWALVGVTHLLAPIIWDVISDYFLDYNLDCLEKQLQGLKRGFENGTITERNRKAMDSWHMEIRSGVR